MLTVHNPNHQVANWQTELAAAITDPAELLALLGLDRTWLPGAKRASELFPLRVPRCYVARMRKGDPYDPLLRQVLPLDVEAEEPAGYTKDPLQEQQAIAVPGLLHKYRDRVLLTLTGACAVNCRYCFRRHFPYQDNQPAEQSWQPVLNYLQTHLDVTEVILSGGDPLLLKDVSLGSLLRSLATIPHLKRVRFHSRLPIVLPSRITDELIISITNTRLKVIMVVHSNHANELDASVKLACDRLRAVNIPIFNQSVILKGINDNLSALMDLSESLFAYGIQPYYLHLLDKVQGAAHFAVDEAKVKDLIWQMMQNLPGYLVPRLVQEQAGAPAKVPIAIL